MIKGDEGRDKVSLSEGWSSAGENQEHDGVTYAVYSHAADDPSLDPSLILIQLGLIA